MNTQPLVSILIPAYNAAQWIIDALESAVGQTWPHKEIIVLDDGSTDETLLIARRFESRGVTVVTQPNGGAAAARNRLFSLSHGDYIQWLDADDLLAPDKIARQLALVEAQGLGGRVLLSGPWGRFLSRAARATFAPTVLWQDWSRLEWLLHKMEQNVYMQTASWLVSRELSLAAGAWNTHLLGDDDGEYFCRVLLASDGVRFVPDAKIYYRMPGAGNLSYIGASFAKMDAQYRSMELTIGYLRSMEDSDRTRAACVTYLQTWLMNFHPERPDIVARAQQLAADLGGTLSLARRSWKYAWIDAAFGHQAGKRAQLAWSHAKWSALRWCDRMPWGATANVRGGG
jgi:glycosyltransferase involved in cell wall biosynthesis